MNSPELARLLSAPTRPPVRDALSSLAPASLEALVIEAVTAAEHAWQQVVVERVEAYAARQAGERPVRAAYFTTTERRISGDVSVGWNLTVAALADTDDVPDLRPARTTVTPVTAGGAGRREQEAAADPVPAAALTRLAVLDPPAHGDILRIHAPTRRVTRITP
ncbi:hypothetical protein [Streptomyces sp. NPDC093094]|uniref:hypothetical protein n=1 Tax=Streptomyces sp. NPDC093094 TaxID=3366026 RepID=UPI00381EF990